METFTATIHTTHHAPDVWSIDLHVADNLFAIAGTSADDGDSDDPMDWVRVWAEQVGYTVGNDTGDTVELTPAPPARWTLEARGGLGQHHLLTTERYEGAPAKAFTLAQDALVGEPDGIYRVITWSADWEEMDRVEVEVHSGGRHVDVSAFPA